MCNITVAFKIDLAFLRSLMLPQAERYCKTSNLYKQEV